MNRYDLEGMLFAARLQHAEPTVVWRVLNRVDLAQRGLRQLRQMDRYIVRGERDGRYAEVHATGEVIRERSAHAVRVIVDQALWQLGEVAAGS